MKITFDPAKNEQNIADRGISFEMADCFDWAGALVVKDERTDYGEGRYQALGLIEGRLHMLVFTPRADGIRVISLRKANNREASRYVRQTKSR